MLDTESEAHKYYKLMTDFLSANPDFSDVHTMTLMRGKRIMIALALGRYQDADDDLIWLESYADDAETRSMATGARARLRAKGMVPETTKAP